MHIAQRLAERSGYLLHELSVSAVEAIAPLGELINQLCKTVMSALSLFWIFTVV